jgi:hypothetical protein
MARKVAEWSVMMAFHSPLPTAWGEGVIAPPS